MTSNLSHSLDHDLPIDVKSVGVRWFHPIGFCINRPKGISDYSFVQWVTPTRVAIDGNTTDERPGGCIIYRPGDPQWYGGGAFTPFGNNWFHFNGPVVADMLEECELPLNEPFYLRDDSFIEQTLQLLLWESMRERFAWKRVLSAHAELFFVEAARTLMDDSSRRRSARNIELQGKFMDFHEKLKATCAEPWTLALMASELHLSVSQFSRLYREFFKSKPIDDLIGMRINMAEYYLRATSMPINHIANMAGFTDIYYFSRVFKTKTGQTATAYRKLYNSGEVD